MKREQDTLPPLHPLPTQKNPGFSTTGAPRCWCVMGEGVCEALRAKRAQGHLSEAAAPLPSLSLEAEQLKSGM